MVTSVPPVSDPLIGDTDRIDGAGAYVKTDAS
jgi:hypothetical protein